MIEFLLIFMIGTTVVDRTQTFADIDQCRYFASRLTNQPAIPQPKSENDPIAYKRITAYCKPIPKRK